MSFLSEKISEEYEQANNNEKILHKETGLWEFFIVVFMQQLLEYLNIKMSYVNEDNYQH